MKFNMSWWTLQLTLVGLDSRSRKCQILMRKVASELRWWAKALRKQNKYELRVNNFVKRIDELLKCKCRNAFLTSIWNFTQAWPVGRAYFSNSSLVSRTSLWKLNHIPLLLCQATTKNGINRQQNAMNKLRESSEVKNWNWSMCGCNLPLAIHQWSKSKWSSSPLIKRSPVQLS